MSDCIVGQTVRANLGWGADFISHWGGGLGNFATYANVWG